MKPSHTKSTILSSTLQILVGLFLLGNQIACGGGSGSNNPCNQTANLSGSSNTSFTATAGLFTTSPITVDNIQNIIALGNLNPPGHTFPSDHIYFVVNNSTAGANTIFAPASGTVVSLYSPSGETGDQKMIVKVDKSFFYYLDHITVSGIDVGSSLTAGQILGTNSGQAAAIDLGVFNFNNQSVAGIINSCWQELEKYTDAPLQYYEDPLRQTLYDKVGRTGSDKDGKIGYDIAGFLAGDWFQAGSENSFSTSQQLAFVYDVFDPTNMQISIGGTVTDSGLFDVQDDATDFGSVSTASGLVFYQLYPNNSATQQGLLLVQMLTDRRIEVEYFSGTATTGSFDGNALFYVR